jgi:hypothetical protein
MSTPSNGITTEVIREVMPHYHLNTDLPGETLRVLPPPPPNASTPWRHARITRLVQEIGGLMPADRPQARIAAQFVIVREIADDSFRRSNAPGLTIEQVCQLRRVGADLARTALSAARTLTRRQFKPAPFSGTVEADAVDIAALDSRWRNEPGDDRPAAPDPTAPRPNGHATPDPHSTPANQAPPVHGVGANPPPGQPAAAPPLQDAAPSPMAVLPIATASPSQACNRAQRRHTQRERWRPIEISRTNPCNHPPPGCNQVMRHGHTARPPGRRRCRFFSHVRPVVSLTWVPASQPRSPRQALLDRGGRIARSDHIMALPERYCAVRRSADGLSHTRSQGLGST